MQRRKGFCYVLERQVLTGMDFEGILDKEEYEGVFDPRVIDLPSRPSNYKKAGFVTRPPFEQ